MQILLICHLIVVSQKRDVLAGKADFKRRKMAILQKKLKKNVYFCSPYRSIRLFKALNNKVRAS